MQQYRAVLRFFRGACDCNGEEWLPGCLHAYKQRLAEPLEYHLRPWAPWILFYTSECFRARVFFMRKGDNPVSEGMLIASLPLYVHACKAGSV